MCRPSLSQNSSRQCQTLSDDLHPFPDLLMVRERNDIGPDPLFNRVANRQSFASMSNDTKTMSVPLIINTEFIDDDESTIMDHNDKFRDSEDYSISEDSVKSK